MKILAFTDLHESITALKKLKEKTLKYSPDLIVCCGDISIFEQNLEDAIKRIAELDGRIFLIHGNHETDVITEKICSRFKNITFIHGKIVELGGYTFMGWGGGGFAFVDEEFEDWMKKHEQKLKGKKIVAIFHQPPFGTKLDILWENVGSKSFTNFIKTHDVRLALCGHLHENFGKKDRLGKAEILNPGPEGSIIEI